ncbi:M56 family metallopeptidase [Yaniella flava]|uniref:M56 family metallopeptidase n=1 Tax=Yaniella flava TaxID=287930 RepID=A0ABP5G070_9MICC
MTTLIMVAVLSVTVLVSGLAGGAVIRKAAPALMLKPRLAVGVLLTTLATWLVGFAALGPMLAWGLSGPSGLMPGNSAVVCQRCLDAANPLPAGLSFDTFIPVVLLLALPLLLVLAMLLSGYRTFRRNAKQRRELYDTLRAGATQTQLAGQPVTVIPHDQPTAFTLTHRAGGIVVSTALLKLLSHDELTAVLTHEAAHLRQRHHVILNILHGATRPLRWIPLVSTINAAIPHYLEMAADNAAREQTSTPILASALLKIGEKSGPAAAHGTCGSVALHAAGIDRIRHLIAPPNGKHGAVAMTAMFTAVGILLAGSVIVHLPYLQAVLDGCLM